MGAIGAATGALARMIRNEPLASVGALGLCVAAIALGYLAHVMPERQLLLLAGVASLTVGLGIGAYNQVQILSSSDRPRPKAAWKTADGRLSFDATATAAGVKQHDVLHVTFFGWLAGNSPGESLFYSKTGPDAEGLAEQAVVVPVPTGRYESVLFTANLGSTPINCDGDPLNPRTLAPQPSSKVTIRNACLALVPPSEGPASPTATTATQQ